MGYQNGSFPHPVAGNGDDVSSLLNISNIMVAPSVDDVKFEFRLSTDDQQILDLVKSGDLSVEIFWHCGATLSSGLLEPLHVEPRIDGWIYYCHLDQQEIRDQVEITVEIVAPKDLTSFKWHNQHPDYGDQSFDIRHADYLGLVDTFYFDAAKLYDVMNPPVGSIFRMIEDPKLRVPLRVDFSGDEQVLIQLSPDVADEFRQLGYYSSLKLSLVVLPTLIETINYISRTEMDPEGEDLTGRRWYQEMKRLLSRQGLDPNYPLDAAQRMLGDPILDALRSINTDEEED